MSKILYAASTASHLNAFHGRYISALKDEGHEVRTMASGEGVDYDIPFEKKMLSFANSKCRKRIREILREEGFDLIILNTSLAAFHIRLAVKGRRRPRIVNIVHGYLFPEFAVGLRQKAKRLMLLFAEKLLRSKTDAILTMNNEDFRIAHTEGLTRGQIIPTLGMGIPTPKFTEEASLIRKNNGCEESFVLAFAGELSGRKNQAFLIEALPELIKNVPNAALWLLGDGSEREALEERAKALSVSERVHFLGRRGNPCDFMRACDVYVSASRSEGLPFNIVEALGCEKTVVATRVKGHTDILDDGAGLLFEPGNTDEFVKCVSDIANGSVKIAPERKKESFCRFSEDEVFKDTYNAIKEAGNV